MSDKTIQENCLKVTRRTYVAIGWGVSNDATSMDTDEKGAEVE